MTTIAIIGTGNVGSALGPAPPGPATTSCSPPATPPRRGPWRPRPARRTAATAREAVAGADIIVLAVPYAAVAEVAAEIAPVAAGKVVIDPTNPLKPDYSGLVDRRRHLGRRGARRGCSPVASVVKAFNTLFAGNPANPQALGFQLDALFATDDEAAEGRRCGLSGSIGFRPIHVGPLAAARELEAMAWLNIRLQLISNGNWNTAYALVVPARGRADAGK